MPSNNLLTPWSILFPCIDPLVGKNERFYANEGGSTASTPLNPLRRAFPDDDDLTPSSSKRSRSNRRKRESSTNRSSAHQQRIILKTKMDQTPDAVSPAPPGSGHPVLNSYADSPGGGQPVSRRPRPLTSHQLAMEQNRRERIDYLLAQRRAEAISTFRAYRENEIPFSRTMRLLQSSPDGYDTEDENSWGKGGLLPNPAEEEDYGETAGFYQSVLRKAARRLDRWDRVRLPDRRKDPAAKKPDAKRQEPEEKENGTPAKKPPPKRVRKSRSKAAVAARKAEAEAAEAARIAAGIEKGQRSKPASSRSKRSSGAAKAQANGHASSPAPAPRQRQRASGRKGAEEEDEQLDEIDKELLGELSDGDENPAPAAPAEKREPGPPNGRLLQPVPAPAPAPYGDESSMMDGDGYASSSEREDHGKDEEMDDVAASATYGRNGTGASGDMSDDAEGARHGPDEHHGDESMVGA